MCFPDPRTPAAQTPASWSYDWAGASGPFPPAKHYQSDPASADLGLKTSCQRAIPSLIPADWAPAWVPVVCGQEVQINDSPDVGAPDPRKTGSLYGFADLDAQRSGAVDRYPTPGVWHTMEVRVVGQQFTVLVDNKVINQWDGAVPMSFPSRGLGDPPTMARQFASGYIGLQDHRDGDVVEYRDVRVKELAAAPPNTSAPVVSGDGLTGRPLARSRCRRPCGRVLQGGLDGSGLQRQLDDHVPAAHRRDGRAAHRGVHQDADLHAEHDDAVGVSHPAGATAVACGAPDFWHVTDAREVRRGVGLPQGLR